MSIVVLASTTLTFIGFLFNFLSVLIPGWGESCVPSSQCTLPSGLQTPNGTVCYMIGLFQYCGAVNGMMTCDTFSPSTLQKSERAIGNYYAIQFFMVIAVTAGFWFVLQESVHILFSKYRPADVNVVVTDNKTFFAFTTIEAIASFIAMAIWAHQYHTHQHISPSCGKIYYEYGRSFGFAIVGWMTCFFNILLRILARSKFAEAAGPGNVYTASAMEELPPAYKSM